MGVQYNMTGVPQETLQGRKLQIALGMGIPELTQIANSGRTVNGVDSLTAVMALQIKGPAEKAQRQQQAANQPPKQTVKDQVVAQAAPEDVGIGALPAGEVMTEKAMASGGIVAFQSGGTIEDLTKELNELKRQRQEVVGSSNVGGFRRPGAFTPSTAALDAKIADIENKLRLAQNQSGFVADRRGLLEQGVTPAEFGTPPDMLQSQQGQQGQQGQRPPAGAGTGATSSGAGGYPGVSSALSGLRKAFGAYETFDPMQAMVQFEAGPYARFLPQTAEDIRTQRGAGETKLKELFPQSREEAEELIGKRYAGLEEMFKQREARAEEARKEAETEKGRTAGIGLMQLASELVTKPLTRIDTGAAFQTFKEANRDYKQAQKDFRDSKDKIAEARELQKIGQFEKADALYREGVKGLLDFQLQTDQLANAQDTAYKSGLLNLAGRNVQAASDKLAKRVELGKIEVDAALGIEKLRSEERQAGMYAASRGLGQRFTYEEARTKARTEMPFDAFEKNWITSGMSKQTGRAMPSQEDYERAIDARARSILSANEAYYSGQTAAPSGGGAQGFDPSQWGEPKLKTR